MAIYSGFSHEKWWFSIAMLVHQRVHEKLLDIPWLAHFFSAAHCETAVYLAPARMAAACPKASISSPSAFCRTWKFVTKKSHSLCNAIFALDFTREICRKPWVFNGFHIGCTSKTSKCRGDPGSFPLIDWSKLPNVWVFWPLYPDRCPTFWYVF